MRRTKGEKPQKPYAAFPLFAHGSGQWAKRIHGKERYFGVWSDPVAALNKYLAEYYGIAQANPLDTIGQRVDSFLAEKRAQVATGDIEAITFAEYETVGKVITEHYGASRPVEGLEYNSLLVALSKGKKNNTLSAVTQKRRRIIARMFFHDRPEAKRALRPPSSRLLREAKERAGARFFPASDIRKLVKAADDEFRWTLLLGINCAFGPKDCQYFPGVSEGEDWHDFARVKTGVARRCWLWPETVEALQHQCEGWNRHNIARTLGELCESTDVTNHGFYSFRRTFVTVAVGTQPAIDRICGWSRRDMASIYRQQTFDDQIRAVSESVREFYLSGD